MTHNRTFLLISDNTKTQWTLIVKATLSSLGNLHITAPGKAIEVVAKQSYDVILIDARAVNDTIALITRLQEQRPDARIIVATASPTWQNARQVLKAGAVDYIQKSLLDGELQACIQAALAISLL